MNIAFITILFLWISVPGIILRRSYLSSNFSIRYISKSPVEEIFWTIIPSLILHAVCYLIIRNITKYDINFSYLGYLISGISDPVTIEPLFQNIKSNIGPILLYNIPLMVLAFILGHGARTIVRSFSLDIIFNFLTFSNKWHYLFTREYLDFEYGRKKHKKIDFIILDCLTNIGNHSVIYTGMLDEYHLAKDGGLDRIIIKYPRKKIFNYNKESEKKDIDGLYLVIPYNKILNLNIRYFEIEDNENQQVTSAIN
ncbi:MAG: hypothetical protein KAX05_01340 [Bacteroidales bacterium]|nr:hypothetical protein [Bacteroidales bacterium]